MIWRGLFTAFLTISAFCNAPLKAQEANEARARFTQEAPQKWAEYQRIGMKLQGKKIGRATIVDRGKVIGQSTSEEEIKISGANALIARDCSGRQLRGNKERPIRFSEVYGTNSKYAFYLSRDDASKDWLLSRLEMSPNKVITQDGKSVFDHVFYQVGSHFRLVQSNLWDLFAEKGFVVTEAANVSHGDQSLVRIDFTLERTRKGGKDSEQGWMLLDPNHYWCVLEYETKMKSSDSGSKAIVHVQNKIWSGSGSLPILKRTSAKLESFGPDGPDGSRDLVDELDLHQVSVPEYEFTLSAFGMPEPQGVTWDYGPPYYLWFAGAAIVALALSFYFRRKAAQRVVGRPA
jgi:hypothetical protein